MRAERAEKLERFSDRIIGCRVVVETRHHSHEDVYVAVRDAFDAARRRCEDRTNRQDQRVKAHEPAPSGRIAGLDHGQDCGFIETSDGREIYFHRNSVLNEDFEMLKVGDKGPKASTVRVEKRAGRA